MRRGRHRREYSEHALLTDCSLAQSFMKSVPPNVHDFGTSKSVQLGEESVCRRRQEGSSKILQETRLQGRFDIAHEELYEEKRTPTSRPTHRSSCCRHLQRKELGSARCGKNSKSPLTLWRKLCRRLPCVSGVESSHAGGSGEYQSRSPEGISSSEQSAERGCLVKGYAKR